MTQKQRLLAHLKRKKITRLEAWTSLGILELASRVGELKADSHIIHTRMKPVYNRFGEKVRIAEYSLEEPF
jgi:hypothetical protein